MKILSPEEVELWKHVFAEATCKVIAGMNHWSPDTKQFAAEFAGIVNANLLVLLSKTDIHAARFDGRN